MIAGSLTMLEWHEPRKKSAMIDGSKILRFRRAALLTGLALVFPRHGFPQSPTGTRRVAYVGGSSVVDGHLLAELLSGLSDRGWVVDKNLILDQRYTGGDPRRTAAVTDELLSLKPDIFVASTDVIALAAAHTTRTVPLVFIYGSDPVGLGLVNSLATPGRNVTGFSALDGELVEKRLSLLKQALPSIRKVGVLFREDEPSSAKPLAAVVAVVRSLGMTAVLAGYHGATDIQSVFENMAAAGVEGTVSVPNVTAFVLRRELAELALKYKILTIFGSPDFADAGALITYGANVTVLFRRTSGVIDRILRGTPAADIPIEQANEYEFVINLNTARILGLRMPESMKIQATRLIG